MIIKNILLVYLVFIVFCVPLKGNSFEIKEEEILSLLPEGSKIAEIPTVRYRSKNPDDSLKITYKTRKGIIQADLTGDKKEEIIVAYYTPPHDYYVEKDTQKITDEKIFERAHVVIFETTEKGFRKFWESDGFGNTFGIKFLPLTLEKVEITYPWYIFGVKDIDNDGILELAFSREGDLTMGGKTEIWAWNGKEFIRKLLTNGELHFTTTEKGIEIISVSYYAGEVYITNYLYDTSMHKFKINSRVITTLSEYLQSENKKGK